MADKIRIQVQDIRVGDRLASTKETVTRGLEVGARTPAGKRDLVLDGQFLVTWGAYTNVWVLR